MQFGDGPHDDDDDDDDDMTCRTSELVALIFTHLYRNFSNRLYLLSDLSKLADSNSCRPVGVFAHLNKMSNLLKHLNKQ